MRGTEREVNIYQTERKTADWATVKLQSQDSDTIPGSTGKRENSAVG
jgi:hypothetical protein